MFHAITDVWKKSSVKVARRLNTSLETDHIGKSLSLPQPDQYKLCKFVRIKLSLMAGSLLAMRKLMWDLS